MTEKSAAHVDTPRTHRPRRVLLIMVVVAVVLLAALLWWWMVQDKDPRKTSKVPQFSGQALVEEVYKHYAARNYQAAIELLQGQKTIHEPHTQLLLAAAYTHAHENRKALDIYTRLDKRNLLSEGQLVAAARTAENAQEWQRSISFYRKAKQRAVATSAHTEIYDSKVRELEKQL